MFSCIEQWKRRSDILLRDCQGSENLQYFLEVSQQGRKISKKGILKKWHFRRGGGKQEKWIPILAQCLKTALKSLIFSSAAKWKVEWFSNSALLRHLLGVWNMAQVFFGEINSIMGQVFSFLFWYLDFENVVSRSEDCKKFWKIN